MKQNKKIAVIMGGVSSEREISLSSGQGVFNALKEAGKSVVAIELTDDIPLFVKTLKKEKPAVVFNALHGKYGEDGCVQGLLNMMHIPYTHSGILASAIAMNKMLTKKIAKSLGIFTAEEMMVTKEDILAGKELKMPYVVKPNDDGSSIGLFVIQNEKDRAKMLNKWPFEGPVLMEAYIPGRELSVAVSDEKPLGVVEIVSESGLYDYDSKYNVSTTKHFVPAPIPKDVYESVMQQAFFIHRALGCRGISRSDFRYDDTNPTVPDKIVFLETNTCPGMTPTSLVPDIARYAELSYTDLILWLIERATCDK